MSHWPRFAILSLVLISLGNLAQAQPATQPAGNWERFRGPTGMGLSDEKNLPMTWGGPDKTNVLWSVPLKGEGNASPIVWGGRVFVESVTGPLKKIQIPVHHLTCYQASDGTMLWDTVVEPGPWKRDDFRPGAGGGYASSTPVTDGKMIYCAFGSSVLAALDFDGKPVWRVVIDPHDFDVCLGSSPIIYQDTVVMLCAMSKPEDSKITAYARADGKVVWEAKLPGTGSAHSTPVVVNIGGQEQMLITSGGLSDVGNALQSLDPASGRRLWWCKGSGQTTSPVYGDGLVYYDSGRGGAGTVVDATGSGDVSATHIKAVIRAGGDISSPLIHDKYLYRLNQSTLACFELATGKKIYAEKLAGLSSGRASPIVDGQGRIFFANGGKSYVIQSGPEFKVLGTGDLGDANDASPAVADGKLFILGTKNLYCVGNK